MEDTTFPWTLSYAEIYYVIEGQLNILINGQAIIAGLWEVIYILNGSTIQFSVTGKAALYFVYPVNWAEQ